MIDVEIILRNTDMALAISNLGLVFERKKNKNGSELYFSCPTDNHRDDPEKKRCSIAEGGKYQGRFNCWACDFKGNLIHLIRHIRSCSFNEAIEFVSTISNVDASLAGTDGLKFALKMSKPIDENKEIELPTFDLPSDFKLLTKINSREAENARKWLNHERNITCEFMDKFQVGASVHPALGFSVVIPVIFLDRIHSIFWCQPWKGGLKRYPKNSPQGEILFNFDNAIRSDCPVMMESILDVIKFECVTGQVGVSCFTNMISSRQLDLIKNFNACGVMPDLDGERGWDLVVRMLPVVGDDMMIYFCPVGKDPGDCSDLELFSAIQNRMRYCDYSSQYFENQSKIDVQKVFTVEK